AFAPQALILAEACIREDANGPHQTYRAGDRRSGEDRRILQAAFRPDRALSPADRYRRERCLAQRRLYQFRDPEIRHRRRAKARAGTEFRVARHPPYRLPGGRYSGDSRGFGGGGRPTRADRPVAAARGPAHGAAQRSGQPEISRPRCGAFRCASARLGRVDRAGNGPVRADAGQASRRITVQDRFAQAGVRPAARFFSSRAAIAASRSSSNLARSTTGTSIILPSTVTAPTPSANALS